MSTNEAGRSVEELDGRGSSVNCESRWPPVDDTAAGQLSRDVPATSGHPLRTVSDLHAFSIEEPELFWRTLVDWSELPWSGSADTVLVGDDVETAQFFPDLRLNYAEAVLRRLPDLDDEAPAVVSLHSDRPAERLTRRELRHAVATAATALASAGITAGTPIMAIGPNNAQFAVAVLAAVALGATVATAAPDIGTATLISRFEQMEPALMLVDRAQLPGGVEEGITALLAGLPTVRQVVVLDEEALPAGGAGPAVRLSESRRHDARSRGH